MRCSGRLPKKSGWRLKRWRSRARTSPTKTTQGCFLWEAPKPLTLGDYLSRVALATDEESNQRGKGVQLMTAHVAKGLEFQVVFVWTGLEESLFPSLRAGSPSLPRQ